MDLHDYQVDKITDIERLHAEIQRMDAVKRMETLAAQKHDSYKESYYKMAEEGVLLLTRDEIDAVFRTVSIIEEIELRKQQYKKEQRIGNFIASCTIVVIALCLFFIYFLPR